MCPCSNLHNLCDYFFKAIAAFAVYLRIAIFMTEPTIEAAEARRLYPYQEEAVGKIFNRLEELPPQCESFISTAYGWG